LKIKSLDETHDLSFRWNRITLLPARMDDGVEEAAKMISSGKFGISDSPPQFEEFGSPSDLQPPVAEDVTPPTYKESKPKIESQGSKLFGAS